MVSFGNFENNYEYKQKYDNVMKELYEKYIYKHVAEHIIDEMLENITVEDSKKSVNWNDTLEYNVYDNLSNNVEDVVEDVQDVVEDVQDYVEEFTEESLDLIQQNINKEVEDIKEVVSEIAEDAKEKIDETVKHTNNCMNEIKDYVDDNFNKEEIKSRFTNKLDDFPYDEDELNTSIHHVDSYEINENKKSLKKDYKKRKSFLSRFFSMFKFW
tara:strand:+ start:250 stop:888 length:639 start_codon:yes stop_codon:yes gene_type:complete